MGTDSDLSSTEPGRTTQRTLVPRPCHLQVARLALRRHPHTGQPAAATASQTVLTNRSSLKKVDRGASL